MYGRGLYKVPVTIYKPCSDTASDSLRCEFSHCCGYIKSKYLFCATYPKCISVSILLYQFAHTLSRFCAKCFRYFHKNRCNFRKIQQNCNEQPKENPARIGRFKTKTVDFHCKQRNSFPPFPLRSSPAVNPAGFTIILRIIDAENSENRLKERLIQAFSAVLLRHPQEWADETAVFPKKSCIGLRRII